ncbi:putative ubiquitin conjugating enzyme family protein [Venturia nashicola]|uniref:Putative ubiquitin conjugating enzyme family protein n=1 Tax=Venturia nashicola TaxID=86259 RepID=A0A4Z1P901_9PEZI|nr:putative ubiquitin conjugating enzyme family protein [Venturia nashicola]TLD36111.1 putative ubiquitin conjugating enzyme family protein [Venturia nashicola]
MSQPKDKIQDEEMAKNQHTAAHTSLPASQTPSGPPGFPTHLMTLPSSGSPQHQPLPSFGSPQHQPLPSFGSPQHQPLPSPGSPQHQPPSLPSFALTWSNPFNSSQHEHLPPLPCPFSSHYYSSHTPPSSYVLMPTSGSSSAATALTGPYGYAPNTAPSIFGPPVAVPTSEDESESVSRQLQAMFDAEMAPGAAPTVCPTTSPFKSDEEYAMSLADGFDQLSGKPIAPPNTPLASPSAMSSVDADQGCARQLQAELDAGGLHRTEPGRQNTFQPKEEQAVEIDLETDAMPLRAFGQQTLKKECAGCKKRLLNSEKDVLQLTKKWLGKKGRVDSFLQCALCSKHTCIGCGRLHKPDRPTSSPKDTTAEITICCQDGRLFLIWALLCAAEHQKACKGRRDEYLSRRPSTPRRANSDPARSRPALRLSNGTGYGGGSENYAAFYDNDDEVDLIELPTYYLPPSVLAHARRDRAAAQPIAKPKDNAEDLLLTQVYSALTELLPSLTGHPFDLEPPEVLAIMLKRSPVLEKAAELLRNDSLDDMTTRYTLYEALIRFVERLASHSATSQSVFAPGIVCPADAGLLSASFGENRYDLRSSNKGRFKAEMSRALSDVALQLETPTRKMLQRSKAAEEDFGTVEGKNMLSLCRKVCTLAEFLKVNQPASYTGKGKEPARPQDDLPKWHRELCVDEVSDKTFSTDYYFWTDSSRNHGVPAKGRMKSLMTELATLQTSLPEGIYVRHGSSRLDMMKIIIIGPNGSPYEGGLFEFDLWCPFTYPNTPPKMHFKTTAGGSAHFNPNLYPDGTICLSLLGTWQGQPWVAAGPNKSTLLQLFISIQAMILCAEPWYNEPGREARPNPKASADFNRYIQTLTISHALTSWLRHGKVNDPVWKEVIEKHFRFNGQAILKSVRTWSKEAEEHMEKQQPEQAPMVHPLVELPFHTHPEIISHFIDGNHFAPDRLAGQIPILAKDFEKALLSTIGIVDSGNVLGTGGEGKRKFGDA